jgi:phosphoglycerol transferase MdoB-like AlkP superfamily enzyme
MSAFEYVSVFISVILGLGVTQALTGIADLIHQSKRVRIYWPHLLWILLVIVMHVQEWWVLFDLRTLPTWRLPTFLFVMLYPITLFILARLLFPFGLHDEVIDLKIFYFENYRRIFFFSALLALLATLDSLFIRNDSLTDQIPKAIIMSMLIFVSWTKTVSPTLHKVIAVFLTLFLIISIVLAWDLWLVANE